MEHPAAEASWVGRTELVFAQLEGRWRKTAVERVLSPRSVLSVIFGSVLSVVYTWLAVMSMSLHFQKIHSNLMNKRKLACYIFLSHSDVSSVLYVYRLNVSMPISPRKMCYFWQWHIFVFPQVDEELEALLENGEGLYDEKQVVSLCRLMVRVETMEQKLICLKLIQVWPERLKPCLYCWYLLLSFAVLNIICLCCTGYSKSIMPEAVPGPSWIVFAVDLHGGAFRS